MDLNQFSDDDQGRRCFSRCLAIVVRNAMDEFHSKYLSDEQMAELNPIIRNAIYTATYALNHMHRSKKAEQYVMYHMSMIPDYWEDCELLTDLEE